VSLDLIFGIPGQSLADWTSDLETSLELRPEHLSLYGLSVEPDTVFGDLYEKRRLMVPDDDCQADMYEAAMDLCAAVGYRQYEISSFAVSGCECQHNLNYWNNGPYLGFGLGAASHIDGVRWSNTGDWEAYCHGTQTGSIPVATRESLSGMEALAEEVMLRIRTRGGVSPSFLSEKYRCDFDQVFQSQIQYLTRQGLLIREQDCLHLTRRGKLLCNEVCLEFLSNVPD
jgi:oxygen-independent coproporphyrinogen-3 oxidase